MKGGLITWSRQIWVKPSISEMLQVTVILRTPCKQVEINHKITFFISPLFDSCHQTNCSPVLGARSGIWTLAAGLFPSNPPFFAWLFSLNASYPWRKENIYSWAETTPLCFSITRVKQAYRNRALSCKSLGFFLNMNSCWKYFSQVSFIHNSLLISLLPPYLEC